MADMTAFERQVQGHIHRFVGPVHPVDDLAIFDAVVAASRSQGWGSRMFSAFKVAVATAIVALFGGFLLITITPLPRSDEVAPAAVTGSPSPMTTRDLLSRMVTEEVEPGVYRVLDDGVRDLASVDASDIVAGYDGGIRLLQEVGFIRLGVDRSQQWPEGVTPSSHVFEVAPDGTMWVIPRLDSNPGSVAVSPDFRSGTGFRSTDGEAWTAQPCPDECHGVTVAPDGSVWASWGPPLETTIGRLGPSGWEPVTGPTQPQAWVYILFATEAGDLYVWCVGYGDSLYRIEDVRPGGDGHLELVFIHVRFLVDVGWDGTLWVDGESMLYRADEGVVLPLPGAELARLRDGEWEHWSAADLPQIRYGFGYDPQFEAAPDGSVWFSLWRSSDGSDPRRGGYSYREERAAAVSDGRMVCDGLARFDGESLQQFFPGQCIKMDIAADGSAWLLSDAEEGKALYVITPEAVTAAG